MWKFLKTDIMKNFLLILGISLFSHYTIEAQHFIGFEKAVMNERVKMEMRGFRLDNSAVNPVFNYLKYVNNAGTKTLLIFFDDNDISNRVRLICDYSEYSFIKADFDGRYKSTGKDNWEYDEGSETFSVIIEEKEWYFVVHIKKKLK